VPEQFLNDAVSCWQSGRHSEAEQLCKSALNDESTALAAHRLLGEMYTALGRWAEGIVACRRVLELAPADAANLRRLATLLAQTGDLGCAISALEQSLIIEPDNPRALNNLGKFLIGLGRPSDAIRFLERAVAVNPSYPIAVYNLGLALSRTGRLERAIDHYERALSLEERFPEALTDMARALMARGRVAEALASFDRALALQPSSAKAHAGRGLALAATGRCDDALSAYETAARLDPRDSSVFLEIGHLMVRLGRLENALAAFCAANDLNPSDITALQCRTLTQIALHRHEEALPGLLALSVAAPWTDYLAGSKFHSRLHCCDWSDFEVESRTIAERVRRGERADAPLTFIVHNDNPADQRRCAETYVLDRCSIDRSAMRPSSRSSKQRLRVAYISGDFRAHPVAQLMAGVFESRDRSRIEAYAFSLGQSDGSQIRERLKRSFDHFFEVSAMTDAAIAARIAELSIDVAVDLGGHTLGARTRVLAYRPATVQVSFLGFPGTSGADFIDYIIADRHVIPETDRVHYTEQIIYLPDSYLPNDFPMTINPAPSRLEAGLPARGIVFCCFNAPYKISPKIFDVWMRVLNSVPESVAWLRDVSASARVNLSMEAERRGVDPKRLIYAPHVPSLADHYARLSLADLFLDTHPYNAHTTASDALRAGVPVITLPGNSFASRVATSLLNAVGLGHLSAETPQHYELLAAQLAQAPNELAALKAHLRDVHTTAPLFDPVRFCRHLETAYFEILARHERGEVPSALWVS
jgi:protein O-GlcNAc transferase